MTKMHERITNILDMLLVCLMSFSIIWAAAPLTTLGFNLEIAFITALLFGFIFWMMLRSKVFSIFILALFLFSIVVCGVIVFFDPDAFAWFNQGTNSYLSWLSAIFSGFLRESTRWENLSLFFCSVVVTLLVALVSRLKARLAFVVLIVAGIAVFYLQRFYNIKTDFTSVAVFMLAGILYFIRLTYPVSLGKSRIPARGPFLLMFMPFCIVAVSLGLLLSKNDERIEDSIKTRIADFIETIRPKYTPTLDYFDYFTIGDMGFNPDGVLGGTPKFNTDVKLFILADKPTYLAGRVSYDYDGTRWLQSEHEWFRYENKGAVYREINPAIDTDTAHLDAMEMKVGQHFIYPNLTEEAPETPADLKIQKIIFGAISTKTLFLPQDTMSVILGGPLASYQKSKMINIDNEQLLTGAQQGKDFLYEIQYMETNLTFSQRLELLRASYHGFYRDSAKIYGEDGRTSFGLTKEYIEFLAKYSDMIYEEYTTLPDSLPDRVVELAREITKDAETNCDKAMAIRDYLVENYDYSLDVPSTPKDRDFVDYFLFDLKKGYCSYFATSMAILGRAAGLPTRYVEGFRPGSRKLDETYYFATGQNAHAWADVYFEGYGWVAYEATRTFNYDVDYYFFSRESMEEEYTTGYEDIPFFEEQDEDDVPTPEKDDAMRYVRFFTAAAKIVVITFTFVLLIVIVLIIVHMIRIKRRLRFKNDKVQSIEYVVSAYRYMLKILADLEIGILPGETPIEHGIRVDSKQIREYKGSATAASEIYSAAVYGGVVPDAEAAAVMHVTLIEFLGVARRRHGGLKFFIYQNIYGKF